MSEPRTDASLKSALQSVSERTAWPRDPAGWAYVNCMHFNLIAAADLAAVDPQRSSPYGHTQLSHRCSGSR